MSKKSIKITILGEPMGKQRPKVSVLGTSKFAHAYTPKETINYESKVVDAYKNELQKLGLPITKQFFEAEKELIAIIDAYYKIPKSHYKFYKKTGKTDLTPSGKLMLNGARKPIKKPDCDNIAKICLDALNGIAYHDDSAIVTLLVRKYYAEVPRVEIDISERESGAE